MPIELNIVLIVRDKVLIFYRRIGIDVHRIVPVRKAQKPYHADGSEMPFFLREVKENRIDRMSVFVDVRAVPCAMRIHMTANYKNDIIVLGNERIVQLGRIHAVVRFITARTTGIARRHDIAKPVFHICVIDNDNLMIWMRGNHFVCPLRYRRTNGKFQPHKHIFNAVDVHEVVVVFHTALFVSTAEIIVAGILFVRIVFVKKTCVPSVGGIIVVSHHGHIRNRSVKDRRRFRYNMHLLGRARIDQIPHRKNKFDVELLRIFLDPSKIVAHADFKPFGQELYVGKNGNSEIRLLEHVIAHPNFVTVGNDFIFPLRGYKINEVYAVFGYEIVQEPLFRSVKQGAGCGEFFLRQRVIPHANFRNFTHEQVFHFVIRSDLHVASRNDKLVPALFVERLLLGGNFKRLRRLIDEYSVRINGKFHLEKSACRVVISPNDRLMPFPVREGRLRRNVDIRISVAVVFKIHQPSVRERVEIKTVYVRVSSVIAEDGLLFALFRFEINFRRVGHFRQHSFRIDRSVPVERNALFNRIACRCKQIVRKSGIGIRNFERVHAHRRTRSSHQPHFPVCLQNAFVYLVNIEIFKVNVPLGILSDDHALCGKFPLVER